MRIILLLTTALFSLAFAKGGPGGGGSDDNSSGSGSGNGGGHNGGDDGAQSINGSSCATVDNGGTTISLHCVTLHPEEPFTRTDFYTSTGINTTVVFGPNTNTGHDADHTSTGPATFPLTGFSSSTTATGTAAAASTTAAGKTASQTSSASGAAVSTASGSSGAEKVKMVGGVLGLMVGVVGLVL